jgi:hypothetical protein
MSRDFGMESSRERFGILDIMLSDISSDIYFWERYEQSFSVLQLSCDDNCGFSTMTTGPGEMATVRRGTMVRKMTVVRKMTMVRRMTGPFRMTTFSQT